MKDIVEDGVNALFIKWDASDIAKKMLWAADNPEKVTAVARRGHHDVQQFEYDAALKFYSEKYYEIA